MNHCVKIVRIVQNTRDASISRFVLILLTWVLVSSRSLSGKIWRLENPWSFENFGFNCIRRQGDVKAPLLDLFARWNHLIKLANRSYAIMWLLEETLSHSSHRLFVFTNFLGDSNEHAKFGWKVNILSFLLNFKKRLVKTHNLLVVLRSEVLNHWYCLAGFSLLKAASLWAHIPSDSAYFVRFVMAVASHDDCMFEFIINGFLNLNGFWWLSSKSLSLVCKSYHLLINQLKTVVDWKILADVIDNQVNASLEDPRRSEEARPGLDSVIENFGLGRHEESRVSSDLAKFGISHLSFDNRVNEAKSERVLLHFHRVQVIETELWDSINSYGKLTTEIRLFCFEVNFFINLRSRKNVVSDGNVVDKNALELVCLGSENFIFLECLQVVNCEITDDCTAFCLRWLFGLL